MKKLKINSEHSSNGLTPFSKTIRPIARQLLGKFGFLEIDLIENWESIVGTDISTISLPQKITFKKGSELNGTLHIIVPAGAFALELEHNKPFLIEKINRYFGKSIVSSLKISADHSLEVDKKNTSGNPHIPLVSKEEEIYIESLTSGIKDDSMKQILNKLAKNIFGKKPK